MALKPPSPYPGTFAALQVDQKNRVRQRLAIPKEVFVFVAWTDAEAVDGAEGEVIAQGHLRVHLKKVTAQQRGAIETGLQARKASSAPSDNLPSTNESRYIEVSYDHGDHRFRLTTDALFVLIGGDEAITQIYVQAVHRAIDLLSPAAYFKRQEANAERLALDP